RMSALLAFCSLHLIDRDHFALLWFGNKIAVMEAPPCRCVAAEISATVLGIGRRARHNIENPYLDDIPRARIANGDRPGANMDTKARAGSPAADRCIHRSDTPTIDILVSLNPMEDAFDGFVALYHSAVVIVGMLGQRLDRDSVARRNLQHWRQELAEVTPM